MKRNSQQYKDLQNDQILKKSIRKSQNQKIHPQKKQSKLTYYNYNENITIIRNPKDFRQFRDVPIYIPSIEEFNSPFSLISSLYKQGYQQHGIVKIIPPYQWKPEYQFCQIDSKFKTRIQSLNKLSKGEVQIYIFLYLYSFFNIQPFVSGDKEYMYNEFKELANNFKQNYQYQTQNGHNDLLRNNEFEYWSIVENPSHFQNVIVEYAADLPSQKYGSAFPKQPTQNDLVNYRHPFNLQNTNYEKDSLFQFLKIVQNCQISGITNPWVYLGMLFASFCFHVEDIYMQSMNYLHMGSPKTWYAIPGRYKEEFEKIYQEKYKGVFMKNPNVLNNLNLQLCPLEGLLNDIPIYRADQKEGEFIFTFPKVYHGGFSHGFNCGEAVNLASVEWISSFYEAKNDNAKKGFSKKLSFSIEWLIVQIIENLNITSFSLDALLQIYNIWEKIKNSEIENRMNLIKLYGQNIEILEFFNKNAKYDRYSCKTCSCYCYLSYIFCQKCLSYACSEHMTACSCLNNKITLFLRFNTNV
ncbi:JmjC domain protein, partial [Ichthyophthirius multifiliis]